jgi:hypothetical protein
LAVLAVASTGLLVAGIVVSAALGGVVPSPFAAPVVITEYFSTQSDAVLASGVLIFAASVPLAIYAATASARLRQLGVTAPGATIALAGGVLSAAALSLSGLLQWVLARPEVRLDEPLMRALHDLSFVSGGPASVVFLGLLVAGLAVPGVILGLQPRPLAWAGLVIAALCELTTLVLIWEGLSVLAPIARFPALVWLIVAGALLPHRRPRKSFVSGQDHEH